MFIFVIRNVDLRYRDVTLIVECYYDDTREIGRVCCYGSKYDWWYARRSIVGWVDEWKYQLGVEY